MPSLPFTPGYVLPPSRPFASLNLPSPGEQVGGAWGCPGGGQEHPSSLLPGAAVASPRGKRAGRSAGGRGPRDRSGRWARLSAQRGRGRPRGSAGRQDPESNAAGGVWDSDSNCEPGLCWDEVEMPATPSLTPAKCPLSGGAPRGRCGPLPKGPGRPGGGAGRGHRGSPGSPLGFPDAFPGPHRKAGVRKGRAG